MYKRKIDYKTLGKSGMNHIIDTHIHVWNKDIAVDANTSYTPNYTVNIDDAMHTLNTHNVHMAILVQPSFINFDNAYMIDCLHQYMDTMRGVINFAPTTSKAEYQLYHQQNVRGVRFNIISSPHLNAHSLHTYKSHLEMLDSLGYIVEILAHISDFEHILPHISTYQSPIIIDHMGLSPTANHKTLHTLIEATHTQNLYIKISAPYRVSACAQSIAQQILKHAHPDKIIWGSDMPHTRFENNVLYQQQLDFVHALSSQHTDALLYTNAHRLFFT